MTTQPQPPADDIVANRYRELRARGWTPAAAFTRAYREMLEGQTRTERAWLDTDTPAGEEV